MTRALRRIVVAVAAGVAGACLTVAPVSASTSTARDRAADPSAATTTPIKHFISVMQENHTFDNYFGTYPGADGIPADACVPVDPADKTSKDCVRPFRIGKRAIQDLASNHDAFLSAFGNGAMNGFVTAQSTQGVPVDLAMGHYDDRDIPYYWNVADQYVLFDKFFTSIGGGSVWNHMFWVTGTPGDTARETVPPNGYAASVQTIFDRLQAKGVSWKFYVQNYDPKVTFRSSAQSARGAQVSRVPLLAMPRFVDDPKLASHIVPLDQYYDDLQNGTLPAVAYIVPSGNSEHPPGSIQAGEGFVRTIVNSLQRSTAWSSSALVLTYDSWGGWYDHVAPPAGYGLRTPALLVSAYAKKGFVDHTQLDFTSILRFVERNWSVAPLAQRDAKANDFATAFDFAAAPRPAALVSSVRHPATDPAPTRGVIYIVYGGGLAIAVGLIVFAAVRTARRRPAETVS
ncbi:MAG TPA: alkaline phosphatase family protein [Acidimicrobiia bacterium]|nr:alkaline phosphatase family protein [Acidimicrobiia bacterium]